MLDDTTGIDGPTTLSPLAELALSRDAIRVLKAIETVDAPVRRRIVQLVEAIAGSDQPEAEAAGQQPAIADSGSSGSLS